ncbi:PDZ domain-containing protein [bacterium]|nr:PDZ domain-containing protein [bacterium]
MFKKTFWLIIFILSTLCSYLCANSTIIYLKKIWDAPLPNTSMKNAAKEKTAKQGKNMEEYYSIIVKRDLLQVNPPHEEKTKAGKKDEEKVAPITDLNLKLLGTAVGKGIVPYAIIKDLKTQKQNIYLEGDEVGPAEVVKIYRHKVILRREGTEEMLIAFDKLEPSTPDKSPQTPSQASNIPPETSRIPGASLGKLSAQLGKKIGQNHWVLEREEVQTAISNANQLLTQVRVLPHFEGGNLDKPDGFQLANIQNRSFFDRMGMKSGDIIRSVNGQPVDSPEKAFQAYQRLQNESRIQVNILRNNREISLQYDIND